jgi:hypothetical protein
MPSKAHTATAPLEYQEQAAFRQFLAVQREPWCWSYAVPNGGKRGPRAQWLAKHEGLEPGVPDLVIPVPALRPAQYCVSLDGEDLWLDTYCGLYLEFKRQRGAGSTVTHPQKVWLDRLRSCGYAAVVVFGCDEAIRCWNLYRNGQLVLPATYDLPPTVEGRVRK